MSRTGRGVGRDHLDWAAEAARREGMSLNEWLDNRPIAEQSLEPGTRGAGTSRSRPADDMSYAALNKQLEALSDRLERIGQTPPRAAAPAHASSPVSRAPVSQPPLSRDSSSRAGPSATRTQGRDDEARLSSILNTLDGIDRRIQSLKPGDGEHQRNDSWADAEERSRYERAYYDREARQHSERALSRDIDAIASRQSTLDGYDERQRTGDPARASAGRPAMDSRVRDDIDGHFRALSGQIDALRRDTPVPAIERLQDDIATLKSDLMRRDPIATLSERDVAMIRTIAEKVDGLSRSRADSEQMDRLRDDFADLRRLIVSSDVEGSLQSLESGYRHIIERLDDMRRSIGDPEIIDRLADRIGGIDRAMRAIPQIEQITAIERQIDRLGGQIEAIGGSGDPRLDAIEAQLSGMRQALGSIDKGEAIVALGRQLQTITEKLDIVEKLDRQPTEADPLSTQAIDRLSDQVADIRALITDDHHADNFRILTERIGEISAKLDAAERGRDTRADFAALDQRIAEIGERIDTAREAPGQDLSRLEARLEETMAEIGKLVPRGEAGDPFGKLESRIAELGKKIDTFDPTIPAHDLEALWNLEKTLERIDGALRRTSESTALDQLDAKVGALSERLEAISSKPIDLSEVTELRNEITEMREQFARPIPVDMSVFEKQIRKLVDQIPTAPAASADNREELQRLEEQIVSITRILDATDARFATLSTIEDTLSRIQMQLAEGPVTDTADIARQAARAAVEEFSSQRPAAPAEASTSEEQIRALQNELKRFLNTSNDSAERTQDTLVSLHDTLQSVATRIAKLENGSAQMTPEADIGWSDDEPEPVSQSMPRRRVGADHYEPPVFAESPTIPGDRTMPDNRETGFSADPGTLPLREGPMGEPPALDRVARALAEEQANVARARPPREKEARPEDNMPLEPGSGRPRPGRRTLPQETAEPDLNRPFGGTSTDGTEAGSTLEAAVRDRKADFIAAARRAAQAAAAESSIKTEESAKGGGQSWLKSKLIGKAKKAERQEPEMDEAPSLDRATALYGHTQDPLPGSETDGEEETHRSSGRFGFLKKNRRALLMAAGGLVIILVGLQGMKAFMAPDRTPVASAPPAASESTPAETAAIPDASPSATAATPVRDATIAPAAKTAPTGQEPGGTTSLAQTSAGSTEATPDSAASMTQMPTTAEMPPEAIGPLALRQDAANGDAGAQFEVAARYTTGMGVPQSLSEAAKWYTRSAEQGNALAQYRLGSLYEKGTGVKKDVGAAKTWYKRSAEQGNVKAMHNLAVLYAEGADGAPDLTTAADWFQKAAERGVRDSQFNLGILYTRGLGVERDLAKAYKWFALAAMSGDADAGKKRDEIANTLGRQGLAAARLAVETWRPKPIVDEANKAPTPPAKWGRADNRQATAIPRTATAMATTAGPAASVDTPAQIARAQSLLSKLGYDPGPSDGVPGPRTRGAIKAYQREIGMEATGVVDQRLLARMSKSTG